MTQDASGKRWQRYLPVGLALVVIAGIVSVPGGGDLLARLFRSLRLQKVQAVNVNLSAFTDPNANPALHQMIAQMISDEVVVAANEPDQPAADATAAAQLSGFDVSVVGDRKDTPKFVVTGRHAFNMTVNRDRLQTVFKQAGHPEISVPPVLDGAPLKVEIPRAVEIQ
jgi:hypothetical protein